MPSYDQFVDTKHDGPLKAFSDRLFRQQGDFLTKPQIAKKLYASSSRLITSGKAIVHQARF